MSDKLNFEIANAAPAARAIAAELDAKEPGTRISDRYVLRYVIGHGCTSIIYQAYDEISQTDIALKLIPADHLVSQFSFEQFQEQCLNVATTCHRNIVKIKSIGRHEHDLFIIMELVSGSSLLRFIRQTMSVGEAIPALVAVRIVDEILDGLTNAHAAGLYNFDLRPSKILLMAEPNASAARLKIVDLGITAIATQNRNLVNMGHYLAPELRAGSANGTAVSQVFTLSAIFYELLTGLLPFGKWQPPSLGRQDVSSKLNDLIHRGLSENASLRPQSTKAYRMALRSSIGGSEPRNIETLRGWLSNWLQSKPPQ